MHIHTQKYAFVFSHGEVLPVPTYVCQRGLRQADVQGNAFSVLAVSVSLYGQLSGQTTLWVLFSPCSSAAACRAAGKCQDAWYAVSGGKLLHHSSGGLQICLGHFKFCMLSLKTCICNKTPKLHFVVPAEDLTISLRSYHQYIRQTTSTCICNIIQNKNVELVLLYKLVSVYLQ